MKLDDLKIATQLRLALGMILLLVVGFGCVVWRQTTDQWEQIRMMYNHPLQVNTEVGEFEADVYAMHGQMQAMLLDRNESAMSMAIEELEVRRADAARRLDLLDKLDIGPSGDISELRDAFIRWNASREEPVRLLRAGQEEEAKASALHGAHHVLLLGLIRQIHHLETKVRHQASDSYQLAAVEHMVLSKRLLGMLGGLVLLLLLIGWFLQQWIKRPLQELTAVSAQFRRGHLDVRSRYVAGNEFGVLATAFNTMAAEIQAQTQTNEDAAHLAEIMLSDDEIHGFCNALLKGLMLRTGSQVGAVYFQNEVKTAFVHFASIGMGANGRTSFSSTDFDGELGLALATRQIQLITDIGPDTRFTFAAASGDFSPREILTIPVLADQTVVALISLASVHAYDAAALRLVDEIWGVLSARVNGVLAFRQIHYFAQQLERQNHEMEAQQRELAVQADELTEQNTELEMQKQQLHESNRLKSAFLSNMSHELRTPLNSVIALSGVLNRRLANIIPAEEYGFLKVIERNGKNLLSLINDILDLSRIEAGREEICVSRFSVHECIADIIAMIAPQAREKNITLTSTVTDDLPSIASDPDKCRHILQNLVGNAVKFTETGAVEVSARWVDDELSVAVRDTGIGISSQHIEHIFDEFRQADDSTSRKYGGTGLGLAIARNYARLLGGRITVESQPGEGSTFTLHLPRVLDVAQEESPQPEVAVRAVVEAGNGATVSGHGYEILVVEDSEAAIIQLTDILEAQGYRVQVARNGKEALAHIEHSVPQAMILDLMMPEVDGFQVLRAIRGMKRTLQLPVLVLTAKHMTRDDLSVLNGQHVHQLIQKGDINRDGLLAAVHRMVAPRAAADVTLRPVRRRPARPGKPLLLLVEDNTDNLLTARALLDGHCEVITAEDGLGAVAQARVHQPDLILMDIALPGMDGFGALEALRAHDAVCDIPVLALTASAMQGQREEILARGFDAYVSKPIDHQTLLMTIREFL